MGHLEASERLEAVGLASDSSAGIFDSSSEDFAEGSLDVVAVGDSFDSAAVDFVVGSMDAVVAVAIAVVFACTAVVAAASACTAAAAVGSFEAGLVSVDWMVMQGESVLKLQAELRPELTAAVAGLDLAVQHGPFAAAVAAEAFAAAFAVVGIAAATTVVVVAELGLAAAVEVYVVAAVAETVVEVFAEVA